MVTKEKDEDLTLFLELRRREKEKNSNFTLRNNLSDDHELDASFFGSNNNPGGGDRSPVSKPVMPPATRKTAADKFLNSVADKSDYDWLITPPSTPLIPYLDKESQRTITNEPKAPNTRPTALKERLANVQEEPALRNIMATKNLNSSIISNRRPSRPATPTGRPTILATSKPSRPSTPTSRPILPSAHPSRASTPARSTARSSTPTARSSAPISKPVSRAVTPTRHLSNRSTVTAPPSRSSSVTRPVPPSRSSSVTRSGPPNRASSVLRSVPIICKGEGAGTRTPSRSSSVLRSASIISKSESAGPPSHSSSVMSKSSAPSRGPSPNVKSRPWKPSDIPGFSLDAPPNLRTTLPESRPGSVSRGRPGDSSSRSSSVESRSSGRPRQQSRSPSRTRPSNGSAKIHPVRRPQLKDDDHVSPVVMGSKMVERMVNMRKLAPPKQAEHFSSHGIGKSSSIESLGFGRNLSKKSLDMAMRHMDIRRSISGNLRPIMTNIPASSMYSVRSESTRSRTTSVSDSPLATSSNASSEFSINNNFTSFDSREIDES